MEEFQAVLDEPLEELYQVTKINRKNHRESRALVLTSKALYNCKGITVHRRVSLVLITGVILNGSNADEFILKIPSEYDYHYLSPARDTIVTKLRWLKTRNALQPDTFTTWTAIGGNFSVYCIKRFSGARPPSPQRADLTSSPRLSSISTFPVPGNYTLLGQSDRREVRLLEDPRTQLVQTCYLTEKPVNADLLHKINDPNLVLIHNMVIGDRSIQVTSEYCVLGDLGLLLALNPKSFSPNIILYISSQIAAGLKALHHYGQAFRELRPSKVLFTAQGDVKLNYAGLDVEQLELPNNYPEYLTPAASAIEADWRALALLVYEMLCGSLPDSALLGEIAQAQEEVFALLRETLSLHSLEDLPDFFTLTPDIIAAGRNSIINMKQRPMRNRAIRRG